MKFYLYYNIINSIFKAIIELIILFISINELHKIENSDGCYRLADTCYFMSLIT